MPQPNPYLIQSYLNNNAPTNAAPYFSIWPITITPVTPPHTMPIVIDPSITLPNVGTELQSMLGASNTQLP